MKPPKPYRCSCGEQFNYVYPKAPFSKTGGYYWCWVCDGHHSACPAYGTRVWHCDCRMTGKKRIRR